MKTQLIALLMCVSPLAMAQSEVKIEKIYTNSAEAVKSVPAYDGVSPAEKTVPSSVMESPSNSPQVTIYNNNTNTNTNPVDVDASLDANVESTALNRTNDLRNQRKNLEQGTEQQMLERIEMSRIEDERRRADRLFGGALSRSDESALDKELAKDPTPAEEPIVVVSEPVTPAVAPVAVKPAAVVATDETEAVVEEPVVVAPSVVTEAKSSPQEHKNYLSPILGMSQSSTASNTEDNVALGLTYGSFVNDKVSIEGGFMYSSLALSDYAYAVTNSSGGLNPVVRDVSQFSFLGNVKYNHAIGKWVPHAGLLLAYSLREYSGATGINGSHH